MEHRNHRTRWAVAKKTGIQGFRPGQAQTGLCSQRRWLEAWNFEFKKKRNCTIHVAKKGADQLCSYWLKGARHTCGIVF